MVRIKRTFFLQTSKITLLISRYPEQIISQIKYEHFKNTDPSINSWQWCHCRRVSAASPLAKAAHHGHAKNTSLLSKGNTILFQGDSITDAGRDKKNEIANNQKSFGRGYAWMAASQLLISKPAHAFTIHNRGISGNKVHQLDARWQKDCIDLKPDILSILIGVNDIWHSLNGI